MSLNPKSNMPVFRASLIGLSVAATSAALLRKHFRKKDNTLTDRPVDLDDFLKAFITDEVSADVSAMAKERFKEMASRPDFVAVRAAKQKMAKPEPEEPVMVKVKLRMIKGSKRPQNSIIWNEKDKMLDVFYLNGYEPEAINMKHDRVNDDTIIVELDERVVNLLKTRSNATELRFISNSAPSLTRPSPLAYAKADIGFHACKYFVPSVDEAHWEKVGVVKELGILPDDYEYSNMPFERGMCTQPDRRREAGGAAIVRCSSMADLTMCGVYEAEAGTPVQIHTKSKGVLEGTKIRTYNPNKGMIFIELFDNFGARFDIDTEYNILPTEEDTESDDHQKRNPILKNRATV